MDEKGATLLFPPALVDGEDTANLPTAQYLIVLRGGLPGSMFRLAPGLNRLGRAAENDWQFLEPSLSRHHAVIEVDANDEAQLVDLRSTNGTFVNGRRLVPGQRVSLREGDRVQLGGTIVLKFERPDPCEEQFQQEMFERSVRDPLTGLFNRAYFLDQVVPILARSTQRNLGLALLMVDVDHFKQINDSFGHKVGDAVLQEVAGVLRCATRADDLVARYGGEEFVAALPCAHLDQARNRVESLRSTLAETLFKVSGRPLRVTASFGVAFAALCRSHRASDLITMADRCLYLAKNAGRNRVWIAHAGHDNGAECLTTDGD